MKENYTPCYGPTTPSAYIDPDTKEILEVEELELTEAGADEHTVEITRDIDADALIRMEYRRRRNLERNLAVLQQRIDALTEQKERLEKRMTDPSSYTQSLAGFLEAQKVAGSGGIHETKTQMKYTLPSGTIVKKKGALKTDRDEAALLEWATQTDPELVKTKITHDADWAKIKKETQLTPEGAVYLPTGEVIPGVTVSQAPDTYEIKFTEPDPVFEKEERDDK